MYPWGLTLLMFHQTMITKILINQFKMPLGPTLRRRSLIIIRKGRILHRRQTNTRKATIKIKRFNLINIINRAVKDCLILTNFEGCQAGPWAQDRWQLIRISGFLRSLISLSWFSPSLIRWLGALSPWLGPRNRILAQVCRGLNLVTSSLSLLWSRN